MKVKARRFMAIFLAFAMIFTSMAFDGFSLKASAEAVSSQEVTTQEATTHETTAEEVTTEAKKEETTQKRITSSVQRSSEDSSQDEENGTTTDEEQTTNTKNSSKQISPKEVKTYKKINTSEIQVGKNYLITVQKDGKYYPFNGSSRGGNAISPTTNNGQTIIQTELSGNYIWEITYNSGTSTAVLKTQGGYLDFAYVDDNYIIKLSDNQGSLTLNKSNSVLSRTFSQYATRKLQRESNGNWKLSKNNSSFLTFFEETTVATLTKVVLGGTDESLNQTIRKNASLDFSGLYLTLTWSDGSTSRINDASAIKNLVKTYDTSTITTGNTTRQATFNPYQEIAVEGAVTYQVTNIPQQDTLYATSHPEQEVAYFGATLYDYDGKVMNANTKALASNDVSKGLYFSTDGRDATQDWNKFTKGFKRRTGITNSVLTGSTLSFANKIIFNGFADPTTSMSGRDVYANIQYPFAYNKQTGYYTFNGREMHVHANDEYNDTINHELNLYNGGRTINNLGSFWPFDNHSSTTADDFFGMQMSVPFYMPTTGLDNRGNDIVFEFAGDDDVWVYVDGKLALDLGGVHDELGGKINFKTGDVTFSYEQTQNRTSEEIALYQAAAVKANFNLYGSSTGFSEKEMMNGEMHTLQIFYMERGSYLSNCKIKFNLPKKNTLSVTKQLKDAEGKDILSEEGTSFEFTVEKSNSANGTYYAYANQKYNVYENGKQLESRTTDSDGKFALTAGQTARFVDPAKGYYKIKEATGNYISAWTSQKVGDATTILTGEGVETLPIGIGEEENTNQSVSYEYQVNFTNQEQSELSLNPDLVVLDYGKDVTINVKNNDAGINTSTGYTLAGIYGEAGTDDVTSITTNTSYTLNDNYGKFNIMNSSEGNVKFSMNKYLDKVEKVYYAAGYNVGTGGSTSQKYRYSSITVMPATTVYYEDNFGEKSTTSENEDGTSNIVYQGGITYTGSTGTAKKLDENTNKVVDTEVASSWGTAGSTGDSQQSASGGIYGYDSSYDVDNTFSYGSATVVTADGDSAPKATFTFKGTGFDLISRTDNNDANVLVDVYSIRDLKNPVKSIPVKTIYETSEGILYQVPIIKVNGLDWGEYKIVITVMSGVTYPEGETPSETNEMTVPTDFYLDAIRIYDPINPDSEDTTDKIALDQYATDKEANAAYLEFRDLLLGNTETDILANKGVVYVDTKGNTTSSSTYRDAGPNNEAYLKGNGSTIGVTFNTSAVQKLQIGAKSANGSPVVLQLTYTYKITENGVESSETATKSFSINSATDRYYDITDLIQWSNWNEDEKATIAITNISESNDAIASLTNLKFTYDQAGKNPTASIVKDEATIQQTTTFALRASTLAVASNKGFDIESSDVTATIADGPQTIKVAAPSGAIITYSTSVDGEYSETAPRFINVGTYVVYYKVSLNGVEIGNGSNKVEIKESVAKDKVYQINYINGGQKLTQNVTEGKESTPISVTKAGYKFNGWYTSATGGTLVTGGGKFTPSKNMTLYAQWTKVTVEKATLKSVKSTKAKQMKVIVNNIKNTDGFILQYSTTKAFKKNKTTTVKLSATTKATISKTVKKLKTGKTYYVRVKALRKDSTGTAVYGKNSKAKKIKVK